MSKTLKSFLTVLLGISVYLACSASMFAMGTVAREINLPIAEFQNAVDDDDIPEITDRVARVSFIAGDVRIRRAGEDEWEKVALNLPLVEGDEITTDGDGRVELQFDKYQHLRLAENSYLKIVNLKDDGIAVSLSLGTMILRITAFDKDKTFFEIDAPKTTLAVQQAGAYRIDAGKIGDSEVRVTATDGGEARVYSDSAGFTLKNGRSTRIFIDGANAGEWETRDASKYEDDFGKWSTERDELIAEKLKDAHYDKFYDNDIYGADDLNDNGDWVYTRNYGYVWRPNRLATAQYSDWSPYRYGHWRWMPPYGWIWVNDEPWGWATYHHGRWFYDDGYWNWSPYGYYRYTRSWWSPAHVSISVFNNNVCWYPLPYHQPRTKNYSAGIRRPKQSNPSVPINPASTKVSTRQPRLPLTDRVPPTGVVTVDEKDFGTKVRMARTAPLGIAKTILAKLPDDGMEIKLPSPTGRTRGVNSEVATPRPRVDRSAIVTGAAPRKSDTAMDKELRTTRVFGGRPPAQSSSDQIPTGVSNETRKTGVIDRSSVRPLVKEAPKYTTPMPKDENGETDRPRRSPAIPRSEPSVERETPRYDPPSTKETPRYDPPKVRESPRSDPTPTRQTPKSDPPPTKSEPKQETKEAPARKDKPDNLRR